MSNKESQGCLFLLFIKVKLKNVKQLILLCSSQKNEPQAKKRKISMDDYRKKNKRPAALDQSGKNEPGTSKVYSLHDYYRKNKFRPALGKPGKNEHGASKGGCLFSLVTTTS